MHPALLLAAYSLACVAFSLLGGWIPQVVTLTHRRMQIAISFVSGVVLGIGLLHLVPHSFHFLGSIDATVLWVLAGFLFMFFLERFFHFHQHDAPAEPMSLVQAPGAEQAAPATHAQHHGHHHATLGNVAMASRSSWRAAAIGLTLHSLVDGLAISAAVRAEDGNPAIVLAGFGTALAVVLHKPFDALTIGTLMAAAGRTVAARQALNVLYALVTPLGIVAFYALSIGLDESLTGVGEVLGFAAGAFICIASSDLLPELQFHGHDRGKLSLALAAGLALAWATVLLEGGHDHAAHQHAGETQHEHGPLDADEHDHGQPSEDP
jgi:zinc and cadmium transporter